MGRALVKRAHDDALELDLDEDFILVEVDVESADSAVDDGGVDDAVEPELRSEDFALDAEADFEDPEELLDWLDDQHSGVARADDDVDNDIGDNDVVYDVDIQAQIEGEAVASFAPSEQRFVASLLEALVLFGLIALGEIAVTGTIGSHAVHPHPYWLVVLPMSAARGVVGAIVAAGIASVLYAIGAHRALDGDFLALLDRSVMQEALLFFAVGFVVGEFRDAAARRAAGLWTQYRHQWEELALLRREKELLAEANHEIKRRLVDSSSQFGSLIRTATRLEAASENELFDVALEMVEEHCGATHCAFISVLEDGLLDLAAHRGYEAHELRDLLASSETSPLVQSVLETGKRCNGFGLDEVFVAAGPLVVAPIADAAGVVRLLLCLDRIPVRAFNDATVMTFYGIADWVAVTLRRTGAGPKALDFGLGLREAISIGPWLGSAKQLGARLRIEDARCSRQGISTAVVTLQCLDPAGEAVDDVGVLDQWVVEQVVPDLRPTDGVYSFGYRHCYVLVLSGTAAAEALVVRSRIELRLEAAVERPFGRYLTRVFAPDIDAPDLASLVPHIADAFRLTSDVPLEASLPVSVAEHLELGRLDDFVRRMRTEWSIAVRNGIEVYVVELHDEAADQRRGNVLARHVEHVARQMLRPTDGVYRSAVAKFAFVLPGATCDGAFATLERVLTALEQRASPELTARIEARVYALGNNYDEYERFLARVLGEPEEPPLPLVEAPASDARVEAVSTGFPLSEPSDDDARKSDFDRFLDAFDAGFDELFDDVLEVEDGVADFGLEEDA